MNHLLPIAYLGPIEYYAFLIQKKEITFESQEHFIKQSIRNRCNIATANGIQTLSIPKERKSSSKTIISKINISKNHNWQKEHFNAIQFAYNSSPFFEYYKDEFEEIYVKNQYNLFDFNLSLTKKMLKLLKTNKEIKITSKYLHIFEGNDLRNYQFRSNRISLYPQVFQEKNEFIPNLSILDLIFNIGPESTEYLKNLSI